MNCFVLRMHLQMKQWEKSNDEKMQLLRKYLEVIVVPVPARSSVFIFTPGIYDFIAINFVFFVVLPKMR